MLLMMMMTLKTPRVVWHFLSNWKEFAEICCQCKYFAWTAAVFLSQALDLVKNYTGNNDEVKARKAFITEIQKQDQSFNERSFPVEESNDKAFVKCFDDKSAKEHCPQRWEAMQTWIQNTAKVSGCTIP